MPGVVNCSTPSHSISILSNYYFHKCACACSPVPMTASRGSIGPSTQVFYCYLPFQRQPSQSGPKQCSRADLGRGTSLLIPTSQLRLWVFTHSRGVSTSISRLLCTRLGQRPKMRIRCLPSLQASGIRSSREECPDDRIARNH